mgnify:CR=1 FL=1
MDKVPEIVSGGQTGVDRAALDAALARGLPCGGYCPEGRLDEEGTIPEHYPLKELAGAGFLGRTIKNVQACDATVVIYFDQLEGGTLATVRACARNKKPFKLIDGCEVSPARAGELIGAFAAQTGAGRLNVAGPRGSREPRAYPYTLEALGQYLDTVATGRGGVETA